jgi:hypothetical protein
MAIRPDEPKLFFYAAFLEHIWDRIPNRFRKLLEQYLFQISPDVPAVLSRESESGVPWYAFRAGAGGAFIFTFVVTAIWNLFNGTWSGTEPNRLYFSRDITNLVEYAFLCPLHVGLSAALICLMFTSYQRLVATSELVRSPTPPARPAAIASVVLFILLSGAIGTANFMRECLDPTIYHRVGWYVREVMPGGVRVLGGLGVWYVILNFVLGVVVLAGAFSYLALSVACIRVGHGLADYSPAEPELAFADLKSNLSTFTNGYLLAKLLTATLMLNSITWRWEHQVGSLNVIAMGLILSVVGVFFLSVPRYYVELEWLRYRARILQNRQATAARETEMQVDDLRPFKTKVWVHLADGLLISGFIVSFWL